MNRSTLLLLILGLLLVVGGCSKRVPSPELTFESHQTVVLTFQSGEEIEGRIAPGKRVALREPGITWTAVVGDVTEEEITLTKLVRVRDDSGVAMQTARAADAQFAVEEPAAMRTFSRSDITGVDLMKFDYGEAARSSSFWSYGAVVLMLLLGERS